MKGHHARCSWGRVAALLWTITACATVPLAPESVRPAPTAPGTSRVAILKSGNNPMFEGPIAGFLTRFGGDAETYNVAGSSPEAILAALARFKPSLVFCLGNQAARFARDSVHDAPVLFALVPNEYELGLDARPNFMGISMEPRPALAFSQFHMVAPKLSTVVTFYRPQASQRLVDSASHDLETIGMKLSAVPVTDLSNLKDLYAQHAEAADAVWLLADPVVINEPAFVFLRTQTREHHKALLTSVTDHFAEAGALLSASLDLTSMGSQAALLTRRVLEEGVAPNTIGVQPPIGVKLAANLDTARVIGMEIDPKILPFINRVYTQTKM